MLGTSATYVDAAGQTLGRELKLKVKVVYAFGQPALAAQDYLVLKQGHEAIAKVAAALASLAGAHRRRVVFVGVAGRIWVLEDLGIAVQRHDQVGNAQRLDDLDDDGSADDVARRVVAMWVVGLDVELGVVARLGGQGRLEAGQERSARDWGGWGGGGAFLAGSHTPWTARMVRLPATSVEGRGATAQAGGSRDGRELRSGRIRNGLGWTGLCWSSSVVAAVGSGRERCAAGRRWVEGTGLGGAVGGEQRRRQQQQHSKGSGQRQWARTRDQELGIWRRGPRAAASGLAHSTATRNCLRSAGGCGEGGERRRWWQTG